MKTKITALFLALLLVLSLTACGGGSGTIGETCTTKDGVEITLHYAEFADRIYNTPDSGNFWKPVPKDVIDYVVVPDNGTDVILTFGFTFKNGSKKAIHVSDLSFELDYNNGYTYKGGYVARRSDTGMWDPELFWDCEPLSENMVRAYMCLPKEVMDENNPLTLTLFGQKYDLHK